MTCKIHYRKSIMDTKLMLWNCRGIRSRKEELAINILNYDIAIVTETRMKGDNATHIRGYDTVCSNRVTNLIAAGGVAIYIKNGIKYNSVEIVGNKPGIIECAGLSLK